VAEVQQAHPEDQIEVWFEDEARFGQQGTLTHVWAQRGSRPAAPKQVGYANVQVLTAVCPATGRAEGLIAQKLDAATTQLFLKQLSATIPLGVHILLVWDGAGWHTAGTLEMPRNITVLRLPPYSPELNPVERLWRYLREHHWSNRIYAGIRELEQAAVDGWRAVCLHPQLITSICRCEYAQTGS
jgi:transposase